MKGPGTMFLGCGEMQTSKLVPICPICKGELEESLDGDDLDPEDGYICKKCDHFLPNKHPDLRFRERELAFNPKSCKSHCCKYCGCKYGYDKAGAKLGLPKLFCPVVSGKVIQEYACGELEHCDSERSEQKLFEILVPTKRNNGKPIHTRFHRVWDAKVKAISGGLTIFPPAKGLWVAPDGAEFRERMIPVRIACSENEIETIADMSAEYYEQRAIMYWLVSEKVVIKHYG